FLGEVAKSGCLTLRTSIIGRELNSSFGLVEWFLSQRGGRVKGFTTAIYTGDNVVIDRSLDSSRFRNKTGFKPKEWQEMINKMGEDPSPYERWRTVLGSPLQR